MSGTDVRRARSTPSIPGASPIARPRQRSFEDLEVPLHEVTFCAVDLETTSGSWRDGEIIEIGAVKSRGGEILGTFETLVAPDGELPVEIQVLTGITPWTLRGAEPLPAVLPSFLEFLGSAVFVAHNARFDHAFIAAACGRLDYQAPTAEVVDTLRLARRLLRDEVRSASLRSLAAHFRTPTTPSHRAFPDAATCLEVLHALIERGAAYGVTTLADLLEIQKVRSDPHFEKIKLARHLPRARGVYLFRNAGHEVVYVGKAADLRARVRSYFTSDERKRMRDLRAEVHSVEVIGCPTEAHAAGLEARLIERHQPRYNRAGRRRRTPVYLKVTAERHPRLSVVRTTTGKGTYLGPFASHRRAQAAASTLSGLFGIRTCTLALGGDRSVEPCALYDLGSCHGPCTQLASDVEAHDEAVAALRADFHGGLSEARARLAARLGRLATSGRYEEAAAHRDAFSEVVGVLERARRLQALAAAGEVLLATPDGSVRLRSGRLDDAEGPAVADPSLGLAPEGLGERAAVARWLEQAPGLRLIGATAPLAFPWPRPVSVERIEVAESDQHPASGGVQ